MANGYSTMGVPGAVGMTRPSMGMTGGTMPNPSTMGMTGGTMPRPLAPFLSNLPLSNSPTIAVNESTPNLDRIQNFPVVSRNGVFHIHQDPATGQRYSMTDEFHTRIPEIVSRTGMNSNTKSISIDTLVDDLYYVNTDIFLSQVFGNQTPSVKKENDLIYSNLNNLGSKISESTGIGIGDMNQSTVVYRYDDQNTVYVLPRNQDQVNRNLVVRETTTLSQPRIISTPINSYQISTAVNSQVSTTTQNVNNSINTSIPINTYHSSR